MADQKNRGGQKSSQRQPGQWEQKQGATTHGAGARSQRDKRHDHLTNPDDATRQATNEQR